MSILDDLEYYDLDSERIQSAIYAIDNLFMLKKLSKKYPKNYELIKEKYRCLLVTRDREMEDYNASYYGMELSESTEFYLDLIFGDDNYKVDAVYADDNTEVFEQLYYDFKVEEEDRIFSEDYFDALGQEYKVLSIRTDFISELLDMKLNKRDLDFLNKIEALAYNCLPAFGDLLEYAMLDLSNYTIRLLMSEFSLYDLENNINPFVSLCDVLIEEAKKEGIIRE